MPSPGILRALPVFALALAACTSTEPFDAGARPAINALMFPGNGIANPEEFEVCKYGSSGTFAFTLDRLANGSGVDSTGTFTLSANECMHIADADGLGAVMTVTETGSAPGFHFDHVVKTTVTGVFANGEPCASFSYASSTGTSATVSGTMSGSLGDGVCDGTLLEFYNAVDETSFVPGRMTGGGSQIVLPGDVRITRGFTIHCDITLSNNIEINWPGNRWHLDKPISTARCIDDPAISPIPPDAPFDTFIGTAVGRLNGVDGARIEFTFADAGEPGGRNDRASITIWDANNNVVLNVPYTDLNRGNLQAHYDQPHK